MDDETCSQLFEWTTKVQVALVTLSDMLRLVYAVSFLGYITA